MSSIERLASALIERQRRDDTVHDRGCDTVQPVTVEVQAVAAQLLRLLDAQWQSVVVASLPAADTRDHGRGTWLREGELWRLVFRGRCERMRDRKGLVYLQRLLERPGASMHVLELVQASSGHACEATTPRDAEGISMRAGLDSHEREIDVRCLSQYRQRAMSIDAELTQAREDRDAARCDRLARERDWLLRELCASARPRNRTAERARKAVYKCIRDATLVVANVHPALGAHLMVSVRTGVYCRYLPDCEVVWQTSPMRS